MKATRIVWLDAHDIASATWAKPLKKKDIGVRVKTIGYVAYEDDTHVVVTHTYMAKDKSARGYFAIPKACIISRKKV